MTINNLRSKHASATTFLHREIFERLNSFEELEARISALATNKERGDAFEVFAEAYLATQKINQAKQVWPFEAIPVDQRKVLSLDTGRDMGVDGTFQTIGGDIHAYQVKFRSNRTALTWEELSTFMGLTDQVSQRVLITNSDSLPNLMQDRAGFVAIRGSDLDRLTAEDFEEMLAWLRGGQVSHVRKQPLPHQQEALNAIDAGLAENDRATVVMACGTGKSLVALWAAEQFNGKTLLVLVPSLALVRQLLHEWLRETSWERFSFLCVCSDPSVAKGADDLVVHQADLDFPVTTESAAVGAYLAKPFDGTKIVFSTYQSAHVVADGLPTSEDGRRKPFDLGIFDEAHKTASREGSKFSFALDDANLPMRKRLFFTATPRHYDVRKKDKEGDSVLVYSMDKPEIYGPVIHTLSFAEAARHDIICDYKVVISVVTSEMVNDHLLQHGEVLVDGDAVKARQVALQIALQKAVEKYGVSRIFTFHSSVAAARSFTSEDGEGIQSHLPEFTTLHVSGDMPTSRREQYMKAFKQAEKAVMSNARCLTEGVDVPAVDMVAFISPRKSKVDIVQATGRAMRKSPGKQFGYVMVPLFVEQASNESLEEALKRTGYDDVWDLLGAMKEQDEVLADIIRQMREDKGRTGGYDESRFSERVEVFGPSVSLETMRGSITAECLENLADFWDQMYGELLSFKSVHGHANVPKRDATSLDMWVSQQRHYYKIGKLLPYRQFKLEAIGFEWSRNETAWEAKYSELLDFKATHGHTDISLGGSTSLRVWAVSQRAQQKKGTLEEDKIKRLESIGFDWDPDDASWKRYFCELEEYKKKHGNTNVRSETSGLGAWVANQRSRHRKGKLPNDYKDRLDSLGFDWNPIDSLWEERISQLISYKNLYGNLDVPQRDPSGLGQWLSLQRKRKKSGELSDILAKRLEDIGFKWDALEAEWERRFEQLLEYIRMHGTAKVPQNEETGLGQWVSVQRRSKKQGRMIQEREVRLNAIGFIW